MNCNRVVDDIAFNSAARRMEGSPGGGAYTWMPDRLTTSSNMRCFFPDSLPQNSHSNFKPLRPLESERGGERGGR